MPSPRFLPALAALVTGLAALPAAAQTPIPPSTPDFVLAVAQSDQYEIEAGEVALAQSTDPGVRAFAQRMIDDHTRSSERLRQAAAATGLPPPPPAISSEQAQMLAALQSCRGADFDTTYAKQQVLAHDAAVAVVQSYAGAGPDPTIRGAARATLPMIQQHLQAALQMRERLGGS